MYKGKIIKIVDDEAIVMVKDYELIRIKRRGNMTVGEEVEFSTEDIIFNFAHISDSQGKEASEDDNLKGFSRVSGMQNKEDLENLHT
ncbi:MAG TPA: anti-sigma factor domain-containing protein [Clostridium sp.]|jgi:hypothetical protein|nr:anti-sigma factor domain-containing protein [Clostridium sp.]